MSTLILGLALGLAATNAAADPSSARASDYIFCKCNDRPVGVRIYDSENRTCAQECDRSTSYSAPQRDYGAEQAEARRVEAAREAEVQAAARRARREMEQRKFEADKAEAVHSLKGAPNDGPGLKGGLDPDGLKGIESGEVKLKGLDDGGLKGADADSGASPKECHIVDECRGALDGQRAALEEARGSQADLYTAMGTADLEHGKGLAEEAIKDTGIAGRVSIYVWKNREKGVEDFRKDYKETIDEASELMDEDSLGGKPADVAGRLKKVRKNAETLSAFSKYMKSVMACCKTGEAIHCVKDLNEHSAKVLDGLPLAEETMARVKAASAAYTKYSTNALKRAMGASAAASKCFQGCR